MAMAYLWTGMVVVSLFFGAWTGNWDALGTAALCADAAMFLSSAFFVRLFFGA